MPNGIGGSSFVCRLYSAQIARCFLMYSSSRCFATDNYSGMVELEWYVLIINETEFGLGLGCSPEEVYRGIGVWLQLLCCCLDCC